MRSGADAHIWAPWMIYMRRVSCSSLNRLCLHIFACQGLNLDLYLLHLLKDITEYQTDVHMHVSARCTYLVEQRMASRGTRRRRRHRYEGSQV